MSTPAEDPDYRLESRCVAEANGFHYRFRVTNLRGRLGKIDQLGIWVEDAHVTTDDPRGWSAVVEQPGARYLVWWRRTTDRDGLDVGEQEAGFGLHVPDAASIDPCAHKVRFTSGKELAVQCTAPSTVVIPR